MPAPALLALESRAQDAVRLWLQHLAQVAPTHCIADDVVASVARDFTPAIFAAGVEAHISDDPQWWRRQPLKALRQRCEWAKTRPPASGAWPARAAPPPAAPAAAEQDSRVVKVDGRKLRAFVAGTADKATVAEVMAAPMRVQLAGETTGREKPFGEWPAEEREKALAWLREPPGATA